MNKVCLLKNQFDPIAGSTGPTGDDAMAVKQGVLVEGQKHLIFCLSAHTV